MEWQALVSTKGEKLTRCGGHVGHAVGSCRNDQNARHGCGAAFGSGGVVEDLDEGIAGGSVEYTFKVSESV